MAKCHSCGRDIKAGDQEYRLRIDLFAGPAPLSPDAAELVRDQAPEFEWLLARLEHMSAVEILEQERQVCERFTFRLCGACRRALADRLRDLPVDEEAEAPRPDEPLH